MGIAAYNRGTKVVSRQIDIDMGRDMDMEVIDSLNAVPKDKNAMGVFQGGVIRYAKEGPSFTRWWVMNNHERGWDNFGYPFETMRQAVAAFKIAITGCGTDKYSFFYTFEPIK